MPHALRSLLFALPIACLIALAAHGVRFGDEHAFGGEAQPWLIGLAGGGSAVAAIGIVWAFASSGRHVVTGTIAAAALRRLLPSPLLLALLGAGWYSVVEALEGHVPDIGLPLVLVAVFAFAASRLLASVVHALAGMMRDLVRIFGAVLERPVPRSLVLDCNPCFALARCEYVAPRHGRAPPQR